MTKENNKSQPDFLTAIREVLGIADDKLSTIVEDGVDKSMSDYQLDALTDRGYMLVGIDDDVFAGSGHTNNRSTHIKLTAHILSVLAPLHGPDALAEAIMMGTMDVTDDWMSLLDDADTGYLN